MRGRLIAFEGVDGSGKTTQARLLSERIGGERALLTSEPGGTDLGKKLRRLLLDPGLPSISPKAEALLLVADRAEHVREVLGPSLESGRWVVTDRYAGSTLAYQGYGRGLDVEELAALVRFATEGLQPDLNVLIELPLEIARARLVSARPDRLEGLDDDFHKRVAEGYRVLAAESPATWVIVDGAGGVEEVAEHVLGAVVDRLGSLPGRLSS